MLQYGYNVEMPSVLREFFYHSDFVGNFILNILLIPTERAYKLSRKLLEQVSDVD